jgi:hypothetical protein
MTYIVALKSYNERHNTDIHYAKSDESRVYKFFEHEKDAKSYLDELNEKYKNDKEYANHFYMSKLVSLNEI